MSVTVRISTGQELTYSEPADSECGIWSATDRTDSFAVTFAGLLTSDPPKLAVQGMAYYPDRESKAALALIEAFGGEVIATESNADDNLGDDEDTVY